MNIRRQTSFLFIVFALFSCGAYTLQIPYILSDTVSLDSSTRTQPHSSYFSASSSSHVFTNEACDRVFVWRDSQSVRADSSLLNLEVWDVNTMNLIASIARPPVRMAWTAEFTPDGDRVLFYPYGGGTTYIWSIRDGTIDTVKIKTEGYRAAIQKASHNGQLFLVTPAISAYPQALACYSVPQRKWLWWLTDLQSLRAVAFSENDSEVIALGEGDVYRINSRTGKIHTRAKDILWSYDIASSPLVISPDGKRFAIWRGRRSDSILEPLFTLLFVWNPHLDVWDIDRNDIVASFGMPKWGFEGCTFTMNSNYLLAFRNRIIYRLCMADESQSDIEVPETPDELKDKYPVGRSCISHDGTTVVALSQALKPNEQKSKYLQLYSFDGRRWSTVISDGGEAVGISFSKTELEIILVCKEMVYNIDAETGKVLSRRPSQWGPQNYSGAN